jgi:hypothetical protein
MAKPLAHPVWAAIRDCPRGELICPCQGSHHTHQPTTATLRTGKKMKRILIAAVALLALPSGVWAGNSSIVIQNGFSNLQRTTQSGSGFAVTTQRGAGNHAETVQNGINNLSVIHQNGANLIHSTVQNGDNHVSATTQVTAKITAEITNHQVAGGRVISGETTIVVTPED